MTNPSCAIGDNYDIIIYNMTKYNMTKKIILPAVSVLLLVQAPDLGAWGRIGHCTIAQIAENHLSAKTLRKVNEYLLGETMAAVSTDADVRRGEWAMDVGFVASNADFYRYKFMTDFDFDSPMNMLPVSHGITIKPDGTPWRTDRDGDRYIESCALYVERWAKELCENGDKMDPVERKRKLSLIIHLIGDMHCPGHVMFEGRNDVAGKFIVEYRGEELRYHLFWDKTVFAGNGIFSISDGVLLTDTATSKERKEITRGDIWDWARDCGEKCLPVYQMVPQDRVLPYGFAMDVRPVLYSQIRNAGYRLAALLEEIF